MSDKTIIMVMPADWDAWIFLVRSRAVNNGIWDLIAPDWTILSQRSVSVGISPWYSLTPWHSPAINPATHCT